MKETHEEFDAKRRWVSDEDDEESLQAATNSIRKSYHGTRSFGAAKNSRLSQGIECESKYLGLPSKTSGCSNFTEPSFRYGSFLPSLKGSVLQREEPNLRCLDVTSSGGVDNEDLWEDLWIDRSRSRDTGDQRSFRSLQHAEPAMRLGEGFNHDST